MTKTDYKRTTRPAWDLLEAPHHGYHLWGCHLYLTPLSWAWSKVWSAVASLHLLRCGISTDTQATSLCLLRIFNVNHLVHSRASHPTLWAQGSETRRAAPCQEPQGFWWSSQLNKPNTEGQLHPCFLKFERAGKANWDDPIRTHFPPRVPTDPLGQL